MCTLVVFKDVCEGFPLVIAANRQEVPTKPTQGPADLTPEIFAPRDLVAGGTWIGVNRRGFVAALTNRSLKPRRKGCRSRGLLVTEALAARSLSEAIDNTVATPSSRYNGFHLFLSDGDMAVRIWTEGEGYYVTRLLAGIHVMSGEGYAPGHSQRDALIRERIANGLRAEDDAWLDDLLTFHAPAPDDGTCVHGGIVTMESIFSMTIHQPEARDRLRLRWRMGRPCLRNEWHEKEIATTPKELP